MPRFELGRVVATPGALDALDEAGESAMTLLRRHAAGDWGDLCREDSLANEESLRDGSRLMSCYTLSTGTVLWVITEAVGDDGHRASTTILLPDEY